MWKVVSKNLFSTPQARFEPSRSPDGTLVDFIHYVCLHLGAFCCGFSGDRLGRFFRWASSLFLNIFTEEAATTSVGRSSEQ